MGAVCYSKRFRHGEGAPLSPHPPTATREHNGDVSGCDTAWSVAATAARQGLGVRRGVQCHLPRAVSMSSGVGGLRAIELARDYRLDSNTGLCVP